MLDTLETVIRFAGNMTYNGVQPKVGVVTPTYHTGVKLTKQAMDGL